jgi:hypothetical protein
MAKHKSKGHKYEGSPQDRKEDAAGEAALAAQGGPCTKLRPCHAARRW